MCTEGERISIFIIVCVVWACGYTCVSFEMGRGKKGKNHATIQSNVAIVDAFLALSFVLLVG